MDGDTAVLDDVISISQTDRQVLAPTYVRLDATAWVTAQLSKKLAQQQLVGAAVLSSMIPKADRRTWMAGADLAPATLRRLRESGVQQILVPENGLAQLDKSKFPDSPTEPFKVETDTGIPTPALQIDSRFQTAFQRGPDPVLGANQLLAELALTSFAQDGTPGGVVLAPPDGWRPSAAFLNVLLDGLAPGNPVVTPTTVDRLFAEIPPAGSNGSAATRDGAARGFDLVRTLAPQASPSLGTLPSRIKQLSTQIDSYASMVGPRSVRLNQFEHGLLLAGSADLSSDEQDRLFASLDGRLNRQFHSVVAPLTEKVTLTSRNADFPLTLQSKLGYAVNVVIDLQASNRLTFPGGNRIQETLVSQRTRVKLRVHAPVSGDTPVAVTVRSPDGHVVLATSRYTVRVTAVSGVGVVLTAGAALFLVIWWIRHWRSSARQRNGTAVPESKASPARDRKTFMAQTHIVTDSACDLPADVTSELDVTVVPLTIRFGDEEFVDGVELSTEAFYAKMARPTNCPRPPRRHPARSRRRSARQRPTAASVVCINLSSELSATMQSARERGQGRRRRHRRRGSSTPSRSPPASARRSSRRRRRPPAGASADEIVALVERAPASARTSSARSTRSTT